MGREMKIVLFLALVIAAAFAVSEKQAQDLFVRFQHEHSKFYATHEEFSVRYAVFKSNLDIADFYAQREEGSATYGVTKFMDLTPEEFTTYYKGALPVTELPVAAVAEKLPEVTLPTSFDWRDKNAVTPVYNQGQCGSCWAFSATETVESYHFLAGNSMISLSMQQVVDCDTTCYGCQGGWTYEAYQYLMSAGGQDTYNSYPYTAETANSTQTTLVLRSLAGNTSPKPRMRPKWPTTCTPTDLSPSALMLPLGNSTPLVSSRAVVTKSTTG